MAQEEERSKRKGGRALSVQESLPLLEKSKEQVLFLRQAGDRLLGALTTFENPSKAAECVSQVTKEAEATLDGLRTNMGLLGNVLETIITRGPQESNPEDQFQKVWRNVNVTGKHACMQQGCRMALEAFQEEKQKRLQESKRKQLSGEGCYDGMMGAIKRKRKMEFDEKSSSETGALKRCVERVGEVSGLRLFLARSNGTLTQDPAAADEVRVVCTPIFGAAVALHSTGTATPIRVVIDEFDNARTLDGWTQPAHYVFQRASQMANEALHSFWERAEIEFSAESGQISPGLVALEDLLLWICSLRDMFQVPCSVTGPLLAADPETHQLLPPIFRKSKLPRSKLRAAATSNGLREAYHLHIAKALD
ncbi:hypothetical protein BSKO_03240 [Bryopsis sp. KO-2023]|nr:hypothetical protein BSKO_03240 [Bryopsis sp. KO-2023]